jgi:hypothetical protein
VAKEEERVPVSDEEVSSFAQKLEDWGKDLPPEEQALLQVLVGRAEGTSEEDVQGFALGMPIGVATTNLFSGLRTTGRLTRGAWVEMGEPWIQWSNRQY